MRTGVNQLHAWVRKHHQVSESALALTFEEYQGERWRYNTDEGYWLQWVGTHWARKQTPEMLDALRHFLATISKAFVRAQIITNAEGTKFQSQRAVAAVERLCRVLPMFVTRSEVFDSDPFLLGTPGGTIDLRTGQMQKADPGDHITILTPVTPADTADCPEFAAFMDKVMAGDTDLQRTMQQWAGIGASGSVRDQRLMFIYGSGRNGKGVYCRVIATLLGGHVAAAPRDLFMQQGKYSRHLTEMVNVVNARMVLGSEIPEGGAWDTALIKDITGGDSMEVRRVRENLFKVKPRCSITIMGNAKPELKSVDEAVRGRFLVVTFPVFIPEGERVPDLDKLLIEKEGPAILRWIIDGAVDREKSGSLFVAPVIRADTEDYFAEENIMNDFLQAFFERVPANDPANSVSTSDAYELWRGFCGRFGRVSGARNPFTTAMKAAGIGYWRTESGRYFTGIRKKLGDYYG